MLASTVFSHTQISIISIIRGKYVAQFGNLPYVNNSRFMTAMVIICHCEPPQAAKQSPTRLFGDCFGQKTPSQ